jgi:hypothetical protein
MVRFVIIGIVVAVAFVLYALVDAVMTERSRARGVSKSFWVLIIVLLPVIGGLLWFMIGKGAAPKAKPLAPDDDPRFTGTQVPKKVLDEQLRELEDRLRELDDEVFPSERNTSVAGATEEPLANADDVDTADQQKNTNEQNPEVKPNPDGDAGAATK